MFAIRLTLTTVVLLASSLSVSGTQPNSQHRTTPRPPSAPDPLKPASPSEGVLPPVPLSLAQVRDLIAVRWSDRQLKQQFIADLIKSHGIGFFLDDSTILELGRLGAGRPTIALLETWCAEKASTVAFEPYPENVMQGDELTFSVKGYDPSVGVPEFNWQVPEGALLEVNGSTAALKTKAITVNGAYRDLEIAVNGIDRHGKQFRIAARVRVLKPLRVSLVPVSLEVLRGDLVDITAKVADEDAKMPIQFRWTADGYIVGEGSRLLLSTKTFKANRQAVPVEVAVTVIGPQGAHGRATTMVLVKPSATLVVKPSLDDVQISVGSLRSVGSRNQPPSFTVAPGKPINIIASKPGYRTETICIDVDSNSVIEVPVELYPVVSETKHTRINAQCRKGRTIPYPAIAWDHKISGKVIVEVTVDTAGRVVRARAKSGPPPLLKPAEEAAKELSCSPASADAQAVESTMDVPFDFRRWPR